MPDPEFVFLGDALWLDLVNTATVPDRLADAAAWRRWQKAQKLPPDSPHVTFADALEFRRQLFALAARLAAGGTPPAAAVAQVNRWLGGAASRPRLVRIGGAWQRTYAADAPPTPLVAVADSAAVTLADATAAVRRCADPACARFFLEHCEPQRRHFCRPGVCGTGRFVERRRAAGPT
jgi:predicted RNA-binding Zn ribbon-like protein